MKNKGFTLVELLAVILILIALAALITPKVFKQLKTAGNITEQEQINSLINISKIYINQHPSLLPQENNISSITIEELKQSELIKSKEIINPNTNEELKGCIVIKEENKKYKYEYKDNCTITVTFNANGGNVSQTSKEVTYGKLYNDLPTPTKEGYTFMGWNGKNLFDKYNTSTNDYVSFEENLIIFDSSSKKENKITGGIFIRSFLDNTVIGTLYKDNYKNHYAHLIEPKTLFNKVNIKTNTTKADASLTLNNILESDKQYMLSFDINLLDINCAKAIISNLQLEEGNSATPYEPYYITNDTTVTQSQNHTLKAIWEANS